MACDLQLTIGGDTKLKCATKIYLVPANEAHYHEDFIIGFAGGSSESLDVIDFYMRPEIYKSLPKTRNCSGLVLTKSGDIFIFDTPSRWIGIEEDFAAAGSGLKAAYGALHHSASPVEAVLAASKVDPYTGMGVKVLKF